MNYELHLGDNLATLKNYPDNTFDSIVTDPPYGIEFLGKDWDTHTGTLELWKECLRVLKPGGYILAFSAARTYHQLASNIELAGFEIRDQLMWLYASGFPKAQDIGKAIDKRAGNANPLKRHDSDKKDNNGLDMGSGVKCPTCKKDSAARYSCEEADCGMIYKPQTTEGSQWSGFKTALKPAHEPIVMARKPYKGSTIDNVLKHGLGALNIDATRVPWADDDDPTAVFAGGGTDWSKSISQEETDERATLPDRPAFSSTIGRYPSNVIGEVEEGYQKYFYCPKVSRKERHSGFETDNKPFAGVTSGSKEIAHARDSVQASSIGNNHPTVKPVALMDYLIKLVTPPSTKDLQRKVLDPFMGSGSTGMAATALGHHFTGCELDPKYVAIAATRIDEWNTVEVNELPSELFDVYTN